LATYTPSLAWNHEFVRSMLWVIQTAIISGTLLLIVVVLLARYTRWGRQYWRITGDYFKGRQSLPAWGLFVVLLLLVVTNVRVEVLLSYYVNDLYSSLQVAFQGGAAHNIAVRNSGIHGVWMAIATYCVIATVNVIRFVLDVYVTQRFIIRWRVWLTHRLTADWLRGAAYYRGRFIDHTIDNPDQRIQQDIDILTAGAGRSTNQPSLHASNTLVFGALGAVVSVCSFGAILWDLSGPLRLFGVSIPKAMFVIVFGYVLIATMIAFWLGHPLIRLSFRNEVFNAAFRYALIRLRDAAEAVGFHHGHQAEETLLSGAFASIIANYRRYVRRNLGFLGWNLAVSQAIGPLPIIVQAPRLFAGEITFGGVMQSSRAFATMQESLSFFRNTYDQFASYRASILRLSGLIDANEKARELPELTVSASRDGSLELVDVEVRTPSGDQLVEPLDLRLNVGDWLLITGRSGSGKTTLLRSLALLWPFASGTLHRPADDEQETMFLPQVPYVPLGDLRAVVCYPTEVGEFSDGEVRRALNKVALWHLSDRLDENQDWAKVLNPSELQRIAFARILLAEPKAVFLDEATSALDEELEYELYEKLHSECPNTIVVSVRHRRTVPQHHEQHLQLLGEGAWRLNRVGEVPTPV
jgi:vitamin B12/bleomycin/antimicrobial peptide transport system ATP-binding/permease protein